MLVSAKEEEEDKPVNIRVFDEDENEIEFAIYGYSLFEISHILFSSCRCGGGL